jgi:biotin carboxyl carrier protein
MRKFKINVEGEEFIVEVEEISDGETVESPVTPKTASSKKAGEAKKKRTNQKKSRKSTKKKSQVTSGGGEVTAPMPGKILKTKVSQGDEVSAGDTLLVLEAMKMENNITAPSTGIVKKISVSIGDNVEADDLLLSIE